MFWLTLYGIVALFWFTGLRINVHGKRKAIMKMRERIQRTLLDDLQPPSISFGLAILFPIHTIFTILTLLHEVWLHFIWEPYDENIKDFDEIVYDLWQWINLLSLVKKLHRIRMIHTHEHDGFL